MADSNSEHHRGSTDEYEVSEVLITQPSSSLQDKASGFGDALNEVEEKLFKIVKTGSAEEVKKFLQVNAGGFDVNKTNSQLHTALNVAVLRKDLEIVKLIVAEGCNLDTYSVELAGALQCNDILQLLLTKTAPENKLPGPSIQNEDGSSTLAPSTPEPDPKAREVSKRRSENGLLKVPNSLRLSTDSQLDPSSSKDEGKDTRKKLKAAIDAEDYSSIKTLYDDLNNDDKTRALNLHCLCPTCRKPYGEEKSRDVLDEALVRLEVCRILSSPAYILATAEEDPIWTALDMNTHLQVIAYWHVENKEEFLRLAARCSQLAVDLIAACDVDGDVETLFKVPHKPNEPTVWNAEDRSLKYKGLHDAVGLLQKQFVTHPTCQHVISKLWLGPYYDRWTRWSASRRLMHVLFQVLLVPIIFILFIYRVEFAKTCLKAPLNRFIYAATSYTFFLAIIVVNQYADRPDNWPTPAVDAYDFIITVWVLGLVCKIGTDFTAQRLLSYSRLWWGTYEAILVAFFIAAGITYLFGYGDIFGLVVANWKVLLLSHGLYAIAMTLAFMRTLQWLHLSSTIGPLVISFSKMATVLRRLIVMFGIVVISFSVGIYTVYKNFVPPDDEDSKEHEDSFFRSYGKTLKILFWAILGKGDARYASIPDNYRYTVRDVNVSTHFEDSFTIVVGYTLWSLFHVAVVVVLLNMLIAVMTHYYQAIQDNDEIEWKFARTKLRMYYAEKYARFPPPFNIVPMVYRFTKYLINKYRKGAMTDEVDSKKKKQTEGLQKHQVVVKKLRRRYLRSKELAKGREQRL